MATKELDGKRGTSGNWYWQASGYCWLLEVYYIGYFLIHVLNTHGYKAIVNTTYIKYIIWKVKLPNKLLNVMINSILRFTNTGIQQKTICN